MRTTKAKKFDDQNEREIEKAISKFSYHLMSNSKWVKLIEKLVENIDEILKIEFKKVLDDRIGEIYLEEDTTFDFDYWINGFEGMNSLRGWILYKEIEYLRFPKLTSRGEQNINNIKNIIESIGDFDFIESKNELVLLCYK